MHTSFQAALNRADSCLIICPPVSGRDYRLKAFRDWQISQGLPPSTILHLDIELIDQPSDVVEWLKRDFTSLIVTPAEHFITRGKQAALAQLLKEHKDREFGMLLFHEGFPSDYALFPASMVGAVRESLFHFALFSRKDAYQFLHYWEVRNGIHFSEAEKEEIFLETGGHTWLMTEIQRQFTAGKSKLADIFKVPTYVYRTSSIMKYLPETHYRTLEYFHTSDQALKQVADTMQELMDMHFISADLEDSLPRFIKRHFGQNKPSLHVENNHFLFGTHDITLHFTLSEKKALAYLLLHPGEIISRDDLMSAIWEENECSNWSFDQLLHRLRIKLSIHCKDIQQKTVKGKGIILL